MTSAPSRRAAEAPPTGAKTTRSWRAVAAVAVVGLLVRLAVVAWAADTFPPAADGTYYDKLAVRLAEGHGYTWLWPDGAVTYAAHYPIGYPALIALGYAMFGVKPVVAMTINALIGTGAGIAVRSLVARVSSARMALAAGLVVALHPVLVPYTAAVMTEGVTTSLIAIAAALAARAEASEGRVRWLALTGLVTGIATLVRPQSVVLAPVLGWLAMRPTGTAPTGWRLRLQRGAAGALLVTGAALAVCAPWTARNCHRMDRCALVSVNGGWNLAIGTQTESGGWHEIVVPDACKAVFHEAAKDECFGREARNEILRRPGAWLARMPAKLRVTFDYFGAAPWYLHTANASRFPHEAKVALGAIETLASRLLLAAALVAVFRMSCPSASATESRTRKVLAAIGLVACVLAPGAIAYLALAAGIAALGWRSLERAPALIPLTAAVVLVTALTHAVFFGAGRYGLIVVPFVTALAFVRSAEAPAEKRATSQHTSPCTSSRRGPCFGRRRRTGDRR